MTKQKFSPQALKICGITLACFVIMLSVAAVNKARGGEHLVKEYTIADELPRHVQFEKMPVDDPQLTAAWYFKYTGLGQFDMCPRLFPGDQLESLNFNQSDLDFQDGIYIREYMIHDFKTLATVEYADQKAYYDQLAAGYGFKEYKIVQVSFTQKWSDKALEKLPQWGDGQYTRDFAVGKEAGFRGKWKIFHLGMM